jgi:ABC-type transport system involved in Fe-S cluster assembly fused permease/ATPase subunit
MIQLYGPLNYLGTSYRLIKTSLVDMENMYDLLMETNKISDPEDAQELTVSKGLVEFKNVKFSYGDENNLVLKDLSFTVQPGKQLAIVGSSGAGKSTVNFNLNNLIDF